tara:strand:- start:1087 stop:1500 length:414 start_codon:yes stop_codon:yes gene_type:complete
MHLPIIPLYQLPLTLTLMLAIILTKPPLPLIFIVNLPHMLIHLILSGAKALPLRLPRRLLATHTSRIEAEELEFRARMRVFPVPAEVGLAREADCRAQGFETQEFAFLGDLADDGVVVGVFGGDVGASAAARDVTGR